MSEEMKPCPHCESPYGYFVSEELYACPECNHEWNPQQDLEESNTKVQKCTVRSETWIFSSGALPRK